MGLRQGKFASGSCRSTSGDAAALSVRPSRRSATLRDQVGNGTICVRGRHRRSSSLKLLRTKRGIIFSAPRFEHTALRPHHADHEKASRPPQPFGNRRARLRFGIGWAHHGRRGDHFRAIRGIIEHRRRAPTPDCAARISCEHCQVRAGLPARLHRCSRLRLHSALNW